MVCPLYIDFTRMCWKIPFFCQVYNF